MSTFKHPISIKRFRSGLLVNRKRMARRGGSMMMLAALCMVMILGFAALAVDYGISVNTKNRLQRTCDAAALAACAKIDSTTTTQTTAINTAISYAAANGFTITSSDVSFPSSTRVLVKGSQTRNFLFGRAIGIPTGTVGASALAGRGYVTSMAGAEPLGITQATYLRYRATTSNPTPQVVDLTLTRNTQEKFGPLNSDDITGSTTFNVIALDLRQDNSGNSGALFQNDLTSGSPIITQMQQAIDPLGSSVSSQGNKLKQAIDDRITAAASSTYNDPVVNRFGGSNYDFPNFPANDPRVVWILVGADGYEANNSNPKLNLQYFAQAYIVGPIQFTKGSNPQATLSIRIMSSGEISANTPGLVVGDDNATGAYDTGAYVNRLIG
jgi:Flp pilus assembly protein TadG